VSNKLDTAPLTGNGTSGSITGLINQAGAQTGALDVADADSLLGAVALASAAEVTPTRWFISGADFISLRKLKDGQQRLPAGVRCHRGYDLSVVRHPGHGHQQTGHGKAVLADSSQIAVPRDLAPSVMLQSERYAEYDEQAIRVVTRYDLGLLHPEGVIVLTAA
jgi:HK97 family phage major capsid protein